ncbi:hypothetical protein AVEN_192177-1 [Araneus ventricosus]|uniref:Uncharacterized protein n=1 Tax=Araneus ventricosus TaxID=182803 RepID=A0A4Y2WE27_ARAVE|nr:hypothetical protein AVEN_192177-1 [Araneus ventricosus]
MSTTFFFFPKKSSSRASRFSNNPSSSEGIKAPLHTPALRHRKKKQRLIGQACCQALFQSDLIASPTRNVSKAGRDGLVVSSRLWSRRVLVSKSDSTEDPLVWGLLHVISYVVAKRPSVCVEVWRGVSAQVSSSSSDHRSKFRGPSQNSPRVASKRDVNITKLT